VFISEVFRFETLGFEQVEEDYYKVHFGMLRSVSLTRKRFASARFRSCDEWLFEVNFRQGGFTAPGVQRRPFLCHAGAAELRVRALSFCQNLESRYGKAQPVADVILQIRNPARAWLGVATVWCSTSDARYCENDAPHGVGPTAS
jgi:hypothetical protein